MTPTQTAAIDAIIAEIKAANIAAYVRLVFVVAAQTEVANLVQKLEALKAVQ